MDENLERLKEVQDEMFALLNEAKRIVRHNFPRQRAAAEAYWVGHIASALGSDDYPTYSTTLGSTIADVEEELTEEYDD